MTATSEAPGRAAISRFGPATRAWFEAAFAAPTPVQADGWDRISSGDHSLLLAPTGSGKTLAAFLWCIDRLTDLPEDAAPGVRVLYISPLKALVYDIERNLRAPLVGISRAAERLGLPVRMPRVAVRTGDTTQKARRTMARHPSEILVTTPESLYLILGSRARATLATVDTIIVDEIHVMAATKRGAHLALSLERLARLTGREAQRIGLSATVSPIAAVARFLGGDRPVSVVDTAAPPNLDLQVIVPVPDMTDPSRGVDGTPAIVAEDRGGPVLTGLDEDPEVRTSIWPAIYPQLLDLIRAHRTTIVFVNSRGLCERLAQRLNELAGEELVRAHHGSIAHAQRRVIEELLKGGHIPAIIATSSLELGIDMGTVDLVVLVESPKSAGRGLQRVGRAGHGVGEVSIGRIFPKHRGDLLEAAVVSRRMLAGQLEPLRVPRNPLDVLAQQVVAMCAMDTWTVADVEAVCRRTASFAGLSREVLSAVLDMLAGRYPSSEFAELRPRILWNRESDELVGRRGAGMLALVSGGTIPDRGLYRVQLGADGPRVGELDEEMVHESRPGQTFTLGASTWRIEDITRDRVIVSPAPGEPGRLPFWHGDGPGRPIELGRAMGAFTRELSAKKTPEAAEAWLQDTHKLDALAAKNLLDYVDEQRTVTGTVPTDRQITIERFRDELGDWRVCILTPFGGRVHAPWGLALEAMLSGRAGFDVQTLHSDDGITLRFVDAEELPSADELVPDPDTVEDLIVEQLAHSGLFASQFRENAARSLLLPRRRPNERQPLWAQRIKAQNLLSVARGYPSFPIILETYRSCLQDVFDVPALIEVLRAIRSRAIHVQEVETPSASPFARSLVFAWVAAYMYEGDSPLAERRAQALTLDRAMLRELLGHEELRELLDAEVMAELEDELQHLTERRRARHADALHDVLRRLGSLGVDEIAARSEVADPTPWLDELARSRRAVPMHIAGEARWIAIEDVALYRDAVGASPPTGVPMSLLDAVADPLSGLVARWGRTHGPFLARDVASRYRLPVSHIETTLRRMERTGAVLHGGFRPGGLEPEWCDPEVLRRLRRLTLAKLRNEVAPVEREVLARFLPAWHGVGSERGGMGRLEEVVDQLEGLPLSFTDLEQVILPARVSGFEPRMLDELGSTGQLVWIGRGSLGTSDGRVAIYRRDRAGLLFEPPGPWEGEGELHRGILDHLEARGASFFIDLQLACGRPREAALLEALWDLVWAGYVTNDTFQPLRALGGPKKKARPARGARRRGQSPAVGGRWSLVAGLLGPAPEFTERTHARALLLLERHGVVCREAVQIEAMEGGFSPIYKVYRAMEESGRVRRGYFIDGLGGAQFAYSGAVDRLRACRERIQDEGESTLVLAATDPANPFGWLLPWPETDARVGARPRRAAGATVVLCEGEPVLYLDKGGRRILTFPAIADDARAERAIAALSSVARRSRGRMLRIEHIDGDVARASARLELFRRADFRADHKGLTLEVR